ncbi:MAG: AAA family ATPase [Acidimicrobiales bacterium]
MDHSDLPPESGAGDAFDPNALPVLPPSSSPYVEEWPLREKHSWWDRLKILFGLIALWWILVWATLTNNPLEPFRVAVGHELHTLLWLEVLIGLELLRQVHYVVSEHSRRWNHFWSSKVFGPRNFARRKTNDWTRFRVGRALRVVVVLVVLAVILAAFYHTSPAVSLFQVPVALYNALPFIFQLAFAFFFIAFQFIGLFWLLSKGGVDVHYPGDIPTRFSDVWGQDAVVERVKENLIFLKNPDQIEKKGGYVPGGVLLHGPPGTGKTLLAEAVAGETHNPFVFVDPGAFTNMFMGVGILKVKSLFRRLRKLALRYGGVVAFFDEADSLGNRGALTPGMFGPGGNSCRGPEYVAFSLSEIEAEHRHQMMMGGMMGGGGMGTLQSLLSEMQGLTKPRGFVNRYVRRALGMKPKPPPKYRILFILATNMPQSLDEALLRPGRIDRIYKMGYPSKAGRIRTFEGYFAKVHHEITSEQIDRLATMTPYATGATMKDLVNEALINAIRDGREVITWGDVIRAKQLKELGPPEDVEYIERERHATALHEACHAVIAARSQKDWVIDLATIEKGSTYLGMVKHVRAEDTFTRWKSDYEADIMVSLASLAGERMFFGGDSASGVSADLSNATRIATFMEGYWGMGRTVTSHEVTREAGVGPSGGRGKDDETKTMFSSLGDRIETNLERLLKQTEALLKANHYEILGVAYALEIHKTITGEDVQAIVNGTEGPFVDGRVYATPEFRNALDAYHEAVISAHEGRRGVEVPMPSLPELSDVLAAVVTGNGDSACAQS